MVSFSLDYLLLFLALRSPSHGGGPGKRGEESGFVRRGRKVGKVRMEGIGQRKFLEGGKSVGEGGWLKCQAVLIGETRKGKRGD